MKIQNPNLRGEELDLVLDYDRALAHFFKMRGLSKDGQEVFNAVVGIYPNTLYGIKEAFSLLDREHDTKVPRYLSEKPVSVQARKKHEYEEAVREVARLVVEEEYRDPMEVRMKNRLAAAKKAVKEA